MNRLKQAYVKSFDGTPIYYESTGDGPAFFLCDGIGCYGYVWKYLKQNFGKTNRIVHMHYRGHGQSKLPEDENNLSIQDLCRDIIAVMDDDGVEKAILFGHSMGVQVILEFAHLHPERTLGLAPMCGSYGLPLTTFHGSDLFDKVFPALYVPGVLTPWLFSPIWKYLVPTEFAYQVAIRTEVNGHLLKKEDFMPYLRDISRVPLRIFVKMLDHASKHSAEPHLGEINVPVLIIGAEFDNFTPVWLSEKMNELIPDSEILIIPNGTHTAPIEMPQLVNLRLEKWLRRHFGQLPPDEAQEEKQKTIARLKSKSA